MKHRIVSIDKKPQALQKFFQEIRDQPVVIELGGTPLCIVYPAARLSYVPEGELKDAAGVWQLPAEIAQAIAGNEE